MGASEMEGFLVNASALLKATLALAILSSCSSSRLKYERSDELKENQEFERAVVIVAPKDTIESPASALTEAPLGAPGKTETPLPAPAKKEIKKVEMSKGKASVKEKSGQVVAPPPAVVTEAALIRQPDIEDREGFGPGSRRPLVDPFRVGEEVVHNVNYFKVSAAELKFKVEPFAMVNNRKSYTFAMEIKTGALFSSFYSIDDRVETFVDYMDLVPRVFRLHVKESGQLREANMLFNTEKNLATFWEKKVTKDHGVEEKKQEWEILPYTQNVYSAIFYMRNFQWTVGKEIAFRVGNDKENLIFSGKAIRREVLSTALGPMKAIVIQPNIVLKGKFKSIGDNFIWLSDDDRKYVLRIESKIKIGTLVSEVISIKPGR